MPKSWSALVVLLLMLLAACGAPASSGNEAPASSAPSSSAPEPSSAAPASATAVPSVAASTPAASTGTGEKITLRVAVIPQQAEEDNVKKWAEGFNKQYPNIEIVPEQQTGDYLQKLYLQASSNTLPDIFWNGDGSVGNLAKKGLELDLGPYIEESGLDLGQYYDSMIELGQTDGKQYMMPRDYNHLVTFYNVDMFKAAGVPLPENGWTWEEFLDAARKLTKQDAGGQTTQYGVEGNTFNWWAVVIPAIRGFGGEVVDEQGKVVVNSPESTKAIDALYQLVKDGVATNFAEKGAAGFLTGNAAMTFSVRPFMQSADQAAAGKFAYDVVTFPKFPVNHRVGTGTSGYCISAQTEHPDEAWAFLEYIMSEDGQRVFSATGNAVPVLKSLAGDSAWRSAPRTDLNHDAFVLYPEGDTLPPWDRLPVGASDALQSAMSELMEKVMLDQLSPEDMVAEWATRIEQAIKDAQ